MPLSKLDCFRQLLEENALTVMSVPNMQQMLPFVLSQERERVKAAINGKPISIIFDGTTHVCEALVIIVGILLIIGLLGKMFAGLCFWPNQ